MPTHIIEGDLRLSDARTPVSHDNTKHSVAYLSDAPNDGVQYARKNATWAKVEAGGIAGDLDGGTPTSDYGAITPIDGGSV